jgi:hypothetical protein
MNSRLLQYFAAATIAFAASASEGVRASTFDLPLNGTVFLQGDIAAQEQISVSAVERVGALPVFDPSNINTLASYEFFAHFSVLDQNGSVVPEPPFGVFGTALHDFGTNCPHTLCSFTTHTILQGNLQISDAARTLLISTNILDQNVPFDLELQVDLPGGLIATTPIPAALPLFASGLAALGVIGLCHRRRRAAGNCERMHRRRIHGMCPAL